MTLEIPKLWLAFCVGNLTTFWAIIVLVYWWDYHNKKKKK